MDIVEFFAGLLGGMLLCICIACLSFVDYVGLLLRIFPLRKPRDYGKHQALMKSAPYKKHKRKWRRLFCCNALVYAVIYVVAACITRQTLCGFLLGLFGAVIGIGIMGNAEVKQKRKLEQQIQKHSLAERKSGSDK